MRARAGLDRFLIRFQHFGAAPSVESYLALFDPDATLFDSGMPRPLTVPEIPEHIEGVLKLVPDFRMTPERWRFREPTIFVEAHNRATLAGAPIAWRSIYCIDLRGDRVLRGRRYYDRRPLFARISPDVAKRPVFEPGPAPVGEAEPDAPVAFAALRRVLPDLEVKLACSAGDDTLVFREWELCAKGAHALRIGAADCLDLAAGRVTRATLHFDTLALPNG